VLLRFEVENHRSILDPIELSMIAVDEDRAATRGFDLLNERVLTVAGIYGPNASGKSNVIEALAWLSLAVRRSLRTWGAAVPRDPFRFGRGPESPSAYDVEMIADGVRYAYRVEVSGSEVLYEALSSYPERRRRVLFERDGLNIEFRRGLGGLAGTRELLTPTTLALSAATRAVHPEIQPFVRHLSAIGVRGVRPQRMRVLGGDFVADRLSRTERLFEDAVIPEQATLFDDDNEFSPRTERDTALALLRFADLGIDDVQVIQDEEERRHVRLIHKAGDQDLPFDLGEESAGTRTWFGLIGPMLDALQRGQILLFDEIDASLHPTLSARLVELFQDPVTNPRGAQLIFTTHDTSLLNHLNRDEVWLTEKGADGATTLTALAEYGGEKVRRSLNLEKAYLQGRFGAVPELDQVALRSALGLTSDGQEESRSRGGFTQTEDRHASAKKTLVVFCEGEKTEPQYLAAQLAIDARSRAAAEEAEIDEFWCVFDVEWPRNHPGLSDAVRRARENDIHLAITNPCFELWLILHFNDHGAWLDNDAARRLRRGLDGSSDKSLEAAKYMPLVAAAARRAADLETRHQKNGAILPDDNPSSGMHRLIASIQPA
jgi:hypothetical protein